MPRHSESFTQLESSVIICTVQAAVFTLYCIRGGRVVHTWIRGQQGRLRPTEVPLLSLLAIYLSIDLSRPSICRPLCLSVQSGAAIYLSAALRPPQACPNSRWGTLKTQGVYQAQIFRKINTGCPRYTVCRPQTDRHSSSLAHWVSFWWKYLKLCNCKPSVLGGSELSLEIGAMYAKPPKFACRPEARMVDGIFCTHYYHLDLYSYIGPYMFIVQCTFM